MLPFVQSHGVQGGEFSLLGASSASLLACQAPVPVSASDRRSLVHKIRTEMHKLSPEDAEQLSDYEDLWPLLTWARFEPLT